MNAKKYLVTAIVVSTMVVAFAASFWQTKRADSEPSRTALTRPIVKFGPMIETDLPAAKTDEDSTMLDLETVHALPQPPSEYFNFSADAINDWIRSNSLDISCFVWPGSAACTTYDMTLVAVERKCWEETTEQQLLGNPALAPRQHSSRRLLVCGNNHPDTYIFRTGDGTFGILRILGLSKNGQGVSIHYKLINPAKSPSTPTTLSK